MKSKGTRIINSILPVALALFLGAMIMLSLGYNPLEAYGVLFGKSLLTMKELTNTLHMASPLFLAGLAIAITFRANLFNMGVEGQLVLGGFMAGIVGAYLHIENPFLHKALCLLAGAFCGLLFALVPAILRAFFQVDEMVVTLTLNYVMGTVLEFLSSGPFRDQGAGYVATPTIAGSAMFDRISNTKLTWFFVISLVVFGIVWFFLKKTPFGYKIEAIGKNPEFSEATGLRVRKNIIILMLLSGALAGLAGAGHMMSQEFKYTLSFSGATGLGWDGMLVSLLANHSPFGILIASVFYSALTTGADNINLYTGVPKEIVAIIQAMMILFLAIQFIHERTTLFTKFFRKKGTEGAN